MSEDTVKLGLMPPLTGLVGIYGTEIARAGQIACREVNARSGVLGRPLELVIEDDGSLPESAVTAANRLVDQHRCVALIGNLLSNSRIAVAYRVAEPRRIPYLNFSFYEGSILSRYFFHFAALPNQQIDRMIPAMRERYGPRMFFAGNNYEWPRGSIDAAKRALARAGGKVVGEEYCPIGVVSADIERLLDQVAAAAPDVFVPYFAGEDQLHLLTRFTERGMKGHMAVVMGHYDEVMSSRLPPEVREGFYSSNTYFMTVDTPGNRDILARLAAWPGVSGLWPPGNGILTNFGEGTYLCVQAFAQAANRAGSLDAEALVDALATVSLSGPQGPVSMDSATHHARVNTYLTRCRADGSFALIEAFGAIDPILPERYQHLQIRPEAVLEEDIRLQARMLEQMSEAVFLVRTDDAGIVYANPGAERMFGYASGELIAQRLSALCAPSRSDPENAIATILGTLSHKGRWEGEIRNLHKDGSPFWSSASVSAFTHPVHGEVWMWVQKDITQMKLLQDELLRHQNHLQELVAERTSELSRRTAALEAANADLESFSYSVSHDLRAPLRAIDGFVHILLEDYAPLLDEEGRRLFQRVSINTVKMGQLIDDLLAFSRMGRREMTWHPLDMDAMARSVADEWLAAEPQRAIEFAFLPLPRAWGDAAMLRQVWANLLGNAVKFSRRCEVAHIEVGGCAADGEVHYWVKDNGAGFDMQYAEKLFGVFQRLHQQNEFEGTGVGLALVRRIVRRHNGRTWAEGKPGAGATFHFALPLHDTSSGMAA